MKYLYKIGVGLAVLVLLASCAENSDPLDYQVDEPADVALQDSLSQYNALKSYVNTVQNSDFKLAAGVSLSNYTSMGVMYRLINSNFNEMTLGYAMKHGAVVQDDGSLDLTNVKELINDAKDAGISVFGHTLVWHSNQNAKYLNSTIAPTVIPGKGGPTWDPVGSADFETDDDSNYLTVNATTSFTADGEGANGEGRALKVTNPEVRDNDYGSQLFFTFSPAVKVGEKYRLTMDIRADDQATMATQAQTEPYAYLFYDFFGQVPATTEWTTYTKEITINDNTAGATTIAFNLGNTATSYYFDNIKVEKYNESGGGGPTLEPSVITNSDFEDGDTGWIGYGNNSTRGVSEDGKGYNGSGHSYTFTNPSVTDFYKAQVAYDLDPLKNGSKYKLNFEVRANATGSLHTSIQSTSDYSSDGFGTFAISPDWKEYTLETTITKEDRNRFIISFGDYKGTIYIDDVTLRRVNPNGNGEKIIKKTPEEKKKIITSDMQDWISSMVDTSITSYVHAWDVVNEPMSDANPSQIKTGEGKDLASDEFYWQDYMGKDYAVKAFKWAREYSDGNDLLFINDYNLAYSLDKCRGLIDYVNYIESNGATVDGIGTQMHISIDTDRGNITEMFKLLAATGKLVKVSELDIGLGSGVTADNATDALYKKQADMYKYVVEQYFENVPKDQRYGITVWSPLDSPDAENAWRRNEPIGLWKRNYNRKRAYKGFVMGLQDAFGTGGN